MLSNNIWVIVAIVVIYGLILDIDMWDVVDTSDLQIEISCFLSILEVGCQSYCHCSKCFQK